jgi:mRNA interferase MazF
LAPHPKLTMPNFKRGDVVVVDLGYAAKVRPAVVVSIPVPDSERNMSVVVPMTTEIRGGECEVPFPKPAWLREASVVNVLGIAGVDNSKVLRRLAPWPGDIKKVDSLLKRMLGI